MIGHWLVDKIYKITTTRNKYGDLVMGAEAGKDCWFREITALVPSTGNAEEIQCDAVVWFAGSDDTKKGDIYRYGNDYYRVTRITKARKGGMTNVEFIKCELISHRFVS